MPGPHAEARYRAKLYAERNELIIEGELGAGFDGVVLRTKSRSAIKAFRYAELYRSELAVYFRLQEHNVGKLLGFAVPEIIRHDESLWVLEMEIVRPPFIVDFAAASVDNPRSTSDYDLEAWEAEKQEQFEEHWPTVQDIIREFRKFGIYLNDVNPNNIVFENSPL